MDWTVIAIPGYFGSMGAEYLWLKRRAERDGPSPVDYERQDTVTSLTMGMASLLAPFVMPKLLGPITPAKWDQASGVGISSGAFSGSETNAGSRSWMAVPSPSTLLMEAVPPALMAVR